MWWGEKEANGWQACEDSLWNKRTTFVFHKIVICNPWTWTQSEDSLKNITYSEALGVYSCSKAFPVTAWDWGTKTNYYISYRVFFLCEATKIASDWRNYRLTENQITPKQTILATDFQWVFKEQFSFKFKDNLKIQNEY